jgi:hypothetical protein
LSLVEVARYATRVEADLARLLLESRDIGAVLFDAEMHSFLGVGALMPIRLMTLAEDAAEASAVLREDGLPVPG